jgi:hypothetical protein
MDVSHPAVLARRSLLALGAVGIAGRASAQVTILGGKGKEVMAGCR